MSEPETEMIKRATARARGYEAYSSDDSSIELAPDIADYRAEWLQGYHMAARERESAKSIKRTVGNFLERVLGGGR